MSEQRHRFTTIRELTELPAEKIDLMVEDLRLWLHCHSAIAAAVATGQVPEGFALLPRVDAFTWIDDGKHNMNVSVSVQEQAT
jgi:hypothetical protein